MFEDARIKIYIASIVLSSVSGVACLFRPEAPKLTVRSFIGAALSSGMCGLIVTLFLIKWMDGYLEALLALSAMVGLGGMASMDKLIAVGQDAIGTLIRSAAEKYAPKPKESDTPNGNP